MSTAGKVTKIANTRPLLTLNGIITGSTGGLGPAGQVPTSNGSNSLAWGSNISDIFVNTSTHVMGPFVNFANGSNTTVTVDQVGSVASNTIRIHATSGGGFTQSYVGYNTIGGSAEGTTNLKILAKTFTTSGACELLSIGAHIRSNASQVGQMAVGLWDNNAGVPGLLIAHNIAPTSSLLATASGDGTYRWMEVAIGAHLAASTAYWIGVMFNANHNIKYDTSGADHSITSGGWWLPDWAFYTDSDTTKKYSIRGNTIG